MTWEELIVVAERMRDDADDVFYDLDKWVDDVNRMLDAAKGQHARSRTQNRRIEL